MLMLSAKKTGPASFPKFAVYRTRELSFSATEINLILKKQAISPRKRALCQLTVF